jgi:DNA replication protein DnaC
LASSGLYQDEPMLLYRRNEFTQHVSFLDSFIQDTKSRVVWTIGPPGVGKTTTTLAFVTDLAIKGWTISWIAVTPMPNVLMFRLHRNTKTIYILNDTFSILEWLKDVGTMYVFWMVSLRVRIAF